jgi:hypothetical protein
LGVKVIVQVGSGEKCPLLLLSHVAGSVDAANHDGLGRGHVYGKPATACVEATPKCTALLQNGLLVTSAVNLLSFQTNVLTLLLSQESFTDVLPLYLTADHFNRALPYMKELLKKLAPEKVRCTRHAMSSTAVYTQCFKVVVQSSLSYKDAVVPQTHDSAYRSSLVDLELHKQFLFQYNILHPRMG